MDRRLLEILVCPLCKGPLRLARGNASDDTDAAPPTEELICAADRLAFPIRDGIPVMLVEEARTVDADDLRRPSPPPRAAG